MSMGNYLILKKLLEGKLFYIKEGRKQNEKEWNGKPGNKKRSQYTNLPQTIA